MKRQLLILVCWFFSSCSFAMFCPNNFNLVNIGDTIATVEAKCGPPNVKKVIIDESNVPQEWTYFLPVPVYGMSAGSFNNNPGTIKFTVAFVNNAITNISSNGIGVGATTICNNINLQIGSTLREVEDACGKPALITKTNQPGPTGQVPTPTQIMNWTYIGNKTTTLIFENGFLKGSH